MAWAITAYATWSLCIWRSADADCCCYPDFASQEYETTNQDDVLSYLSNILGELKEMAMDMGSKIQRLVFQLYSHNFLFVIALLDFLSYLSNIIGELKEIAVDMGSKIERHIKAFNPLDDDVEELTIRVKGVNLNSFELLKLLENSVKVLKILKNKLESMKILKNKLESLKL
nr:SNAP25 homologous protein SNAP33-like [Tanacetum cinerariifolium]